MNNEPGAPVCTPADFSYDFSKSPNKCHFNRNARVVATDSFLSSLHGDLYRLNGHEHQLDASSLSRKSIEDGIGTYLNTISRSWRRWWKGNASPELIEAAKKRRRQYQRQLTLHISRQWVFDHYSRLNCLSVIFDTWIGPIHMSGDETDDPGNCRDRYKTFRIIPTEWATSML
ncbi:hypothetical protein OF83DRAFT_1178077 [Amylostereum chailletii]|nr:hypothetical protein OF83DRAFT_1178077 [Amylostereum chailletii]